MCGRLACRQRLDVYKAASSYQHDGKYVKPEWIDLENCGAKYHPTANLCPSEASPVLVGEGKITEGEIRQMAPMIWGVIPPWHKGTMKNHGLTTNNCRIESVVSSKLYGPLLKTGNRCVVLCDGFYEWQTTNKSKQPYFVYSQQPDEVKIEDLTCWEEGKWSEEAGWSGPNLLYMAGLYSIWRSSDEEEVYSYSVITKESDEQFSWLHHRVPAILNEYDAKIWLSGNLSTEESLRLLKGKSSHIVQHPVSTLVNNAKNKSDSCNKRIKIKSTLLTSWLKRSSDSPSENETKKVKKESL